MKPTVPPSSDGFNEGDLRVAMQTFGTAMSEAAAHNADAARVQSDASVKVAELEHEREILLIRHGFVLRVGGGLAIGAVVIGGFVTGHYELVTHALAAIAGLFAGYGLAKSTR